MTSAQDREEWPTARLLSTAARLTEQAWNAKLRARGVTHAGLVVLSVLVAGPASQRHLAASQYLTEQTIGRTIGHLESTGHITRSMDATDRRRRVVEMTPAGRALLGELSTDADSLTEQIILGAGVELRGFRDGLHAIIERLDDPTDAELGAAPELDERTP